MAGFGRSQEKVERLLKLSWIFQRRPTSLAELREQYRLYVDGDEASTRRTFERDKHDLAELGIELETQQRENTTYYKVARATIATTRVTWTNEELDTLAVLAATVGDAATGTALARLSAPSGEFPAERTGAQVLLDGGDVPPVFATAVSRGRRLSFRYRDADGDETERTVEPWQLRERNALRYLTAWDVDAAAERNFRLDRIVGEPTLGDPATEPRPDGPLGPLYPDEHIDVVALVPAAARRDAELLGAEPVGSDDSAAAGVPDSEGRVAMRFADRRSLAMIGWALRHDARIVEPATLADEARAQLDALLAVHTGTHTPVERPRTSRARPAELTTERLRRMLTLPKWLGERAGVTLEEAATAFGCSVQDIQEELDLLDLIDIPSVGSVVEAEQHPDGQIVYRRFVEEPTVDLSATDALRLLQLVEIGAIVLTTEEAPALTSLSERLRAIVPSAVQIELHGGTHPDLDLLKQARDEQRTVTFDYRGRKDATWRRRRVAPARFVVANGAVYLIGTDLEVGGERNFRLDRLSDVSLAEEQVGIAAEAVAPTYVPTGTEIEVLLRLSTRATWILTHVTPSGATATDDGGAVAVIRTDAEDWLLSHVIAAGGEAEVITPSRLRSRVVDRARALRAAYDT